MRSACSKKLVSVAPGCSTVTVTPVSLKRSASPNDITNAFVAPYPAEYGFGDTLTLEPVMRISPGLRSTICGTMRFARWIV
jgi:hypothetical protein